MRYLLSLSCKGASIIRGLNTMPIVEKVTVREKCRDLIRIFTIASIPSNGL